MKDRRSLDAVDAALEVARREAAIAKMPAALRERILAVSSPESPPAPHGRVLHFALRVAAVAAVLVAAFLAAPASVWAEDLDVDSIVSWNGRIAQSVAAHLPRIDGMATGPITGIADGSWAQSDVALPLGAIAVVLVSVGLWIAAKQGRR